MDAWTVLAWIVAFIAISITYWYLAIPKNLPPGSSGLPLVGYLPFLNKKAYLTFFDLKKKFGNVFHLYLGSKLVLVLNDFDAIKEALIKQGDVFSGRTPTFEIEEFDGDHQGIVMTDGELWKQHRRFVLRNLRDSGVGKQTLEPLILNEIQHFMTEVKKHDDKGPFELHDILFCSMTNNIHLLTTGKRYDYNHPAIKSLKKLFADFDELAQGLPAATFFPWLKPLLSQNIKLNEVKILFVKIIENVIKEHKENDDSQNENYIRAYTNEMKTDSNTIFSERGLLHTTRDLISAGTETSASTLDWAGLYMANYPEIQKKVQDEIDRVIGQREPSYNDRVNTPYIEATICELHRIISLVPLSLPHRVTKDTTLYGYNIPKDTMVLPNIWAVHYDKDLWGDPENFRPERFIGPNGDCVKPEYLIPFSSGKRACAGEPLARMELYLYFVSLLQNFTFSPPKGEKISFESPPGLARKPIRNNICIKSRH
ncbi:hypothetical protein CHUAL_008497 [Chamberlinius hualienensis]